MFLIIKSRSFKFTCFSYKYFVVSPRSERVTKTGSIRQILLEHSCTSHIMYTVIHNLQTLWWNQYSSANKHDFCAKKITVCCSHNTTHNLLKTVQPLPCNYYCLLQIAFYFNKVPVGHCPMCISLQRGHSTWKSLRQLGQNSVWILQIRLLLDTQQMNHRIDVQEH